MADRVTAKELDQIVRVINTATGSPQEGWTGPEAAGRFYISGAYGGWKLERIHSSGSGSENISQGFVPRRQLAEWMRAYLEGISMGKALAAQEVQS